MTLHCSPPAPPGLVSVTATSTRPRPPGPAMMTRRAAPPVTRR